MTFKVGFQCEWVVHEELVKRYAYFDSNGVELSC